MKRVIQNFFMFLGILFMIGIFFPGFRIFMAELVAPILDNLLVFQIHILILILASFTALYSTLIQKYTVDFRRLKEIQSRISDFQKRYIKAIKEKNQFLLKRLEKEKVEIQKLQSELMSMNFRSMFYTVVVTIPIWIWLWYRIYDIKEGMQGGLYSGVSSFVITTPFQGLIHVSDSVLFVIPWWLFWYILCSVTIGQIIKKLIKL